MSSTLFCGPTTSPHSSRQTLEVPAVAHHSLPVAVAYLTHDFIIFIASKGMAVKVAAVSVKKESEDPNYYLYNMQGNTVS